MSVKVCVCIHTNWRKGSDDMGEPDNKKEHQGKVTLLSCDQQLCISFCGSISLLVDRVAPML